MSRQACTATTTTLAAREGRHLPGVEGVWVFVFADMAVFALMFACFMWDRRLAPELFESSRQALSLNFGGINTLILLTSSMFVVLALDALRAGRRAAAPVLLALAASCGFAFLISKVFEYREKFAAGWSMLSNDVFMYYFILTGLHLGHVVVGTVILIVLGLLARRAAPGASLTAYEGGAMYWHMVDLLWVCMFPLLYLVR